MLLFPGDTIVIPLAIAIPLFIWQLWLCRRCSSARFLPMIVPIPMFILALVFLVSKGSGFLDLSNFVAAVCAGIGLFFYAVIALAWFTAYLIRRFKK